MEGVHALAASVLVAAAAWQPPAVVPASGHGVPQSLALAAGSGGAPPLVWSDPPRDAGAAPRALLASRRTAGGAWSRPQRLARAGWLSEPAVVADGSGALAAWAPRRGSSVLLWTARRSGGRWSAPRVVDRGVVGRVPGASLLASPHLASDGHGRAALTWDALTPRRTFVLRALVRTRAGRWLPPRALGAATP